MTQAAPRRKVNGDAAMRPMRSGTRSFRRPRLLLASRSRGSGRSLGALYSAWLVRDVRLRRSLPISLLRSTDAPAGRTIGFTIPGMISSERSISGAEDARAGVAIAAIAGADFRVLDLVADASVFRLMAGSLYRDDNRPELCADVKMGGSSIASNIAVYARLPFSRMMSITTVALPSFCDERRTHSADPRKMAISKTTVGSVQPALKM